MLYNNDPTALEQNQREVAKANPESFNVQITYVKMLSDAGYTQKEIAEAVAEATGAYYVVEDSSHIFQFDEGVIILSAMDGLVAYKGTRI